MGFRLCVCHGLCVCRLCIHVCVCVHVCTYVCVCVISAAVCVRVCVSLGRFRLQQTLLHGGLHGYTAGVKLVRGAYIVAETALAAKRGEDNPVFPTIQDTHDNYNSCASLLIQSAAEGKAKVHPPHTCTHAHTHTSTQHTIQPG